ncbi:MAG: PIN domain-containing protein [Terriglobia bacterium]
MEASLDSHLRLLFPGRVLPVAQAIAARWGRPGGMRELARRPLSAPDGLIAATALEHGLTLVTRNVKDFAGLGVVLLNPWDEV